ncbi:zinc transporter ZIP10-like isoform X1 [Arapaima gigas]
MFGVVTSALLLKVSEGEDMMMVHIHTRFCLLCGVVFLLPQYDHCHEQEHLGHEDHASDHSDMHVTEALHLQAGGDGRGPRESPTASEQDEALNRQRFYIQELFRHYGQQDRLDFNGFQSLLLSLGLGQVRVVGLDHGHLGHDNVSHLSTPEVHEHHHSHSSSHAFGQQPYSSSQSELHQEQDDSLSASGSSATCNHRTAGARKISTVTPSINNDPVDEHSQDRGRHHEHDHSDSHRKKPHHHHHKHHPKHLHRQHKGSLTGNHPVSQEPPYNVTGQSLPQQSTQPPGTRTKRPRELSKGYNKHRTAAAATVSPGLAVFPAGGVRKNSPPKNNFHTIPLTTEYHEHHDESEDEQKHKGVSDRVTDGNYNSDSSQADAHLHLKKREASDSLTDTLSVALANHPHGPAHQHEACLNLTQLLHYYGLSPHSLISPAQLSYMCPAFLYQIDRHVCIVEGSLLEPVNPVWIWGWGFISVTVISLLSLLGVILVPIIKQSCFKFLLTFLVALAVGTLSGDALLHLLPHSQGGHDHSHSSPKKSEADLLSTFDGVWKGLTALAGIYLLFIIEHCIGFFKHYKYKGVGCRKRRKGEDAKIGRKLSDHKLNRRSDIEWLHLNSLTEDSISMLAAKGAENSVLSCNSGHNDTQLTELQDQETWQHGYQSLVKENERKVKPKKHSHSHGHSHHAHCHSDQEMKDAGIASIAWMVIMGDGMHNFSDGLAIGAAFSANLTGGISTSVAVFCHELPHELGDFAVLLKAGMSVKQAIIYNLLSALMAYVGMLIGTTVGQYAHNITSWIFAVTAGMFLYVALVDMLPEMLHGDSEEHKRCQLGHFLLQNVGMLTGFTIMLLIALFEDHIILDFGF